MLSKKQNKTEIKAAVKPNDQQEIFQRNISIWGPFNV